MKKTLLITLSFPPQRGGVPYYLANLAANLPAEDLIVLTNHHQEAPAFDEKQAFKIYRHDLLYKYLWPRWFKLLRLARIIINKEQIKQLIVSHVLPEGYVAWLTGLPYVVILHGLDVLLAQQSSWKKFWLRMILQKAKLIVVNSNFTKQQVVNLGVSETKIINLYPCPHIVPALANEAEKQIITHELELVHKKILLSVGRLVARKGFDKVIAALPAVLEKFPKLIYLIVGRGEYKEELENLALQHQVRGNVIFLEDVNDSHLACYYDLADIFIEPARQIGAADVEGFGIVYLEANLFGKPVIAGNSGGVSEAVIDQQTGLIVEPNNIEQISQAIIKLLSDQQLSHKLGSQGRERVLREFQWSLQVAKIKDLL